MRQLEISISWIIQGWKWKLVTQSCPALWNLMDYSLPGFSVHGFSKSKNTGVGCHALLRGSSWPRDRTQVSRTAGRLFTIWATQDANPNHSFKSSFSLFPSLTCIFPMLMPLFLLCLCLKYPPKPPDLLRYRTPAYSFSITQILL